jgi:hypothetical protein
VRDAGPCRVRSGHHRHARLAGSPASRSPKELQAAAAQPTIVHETTLAHNNNLTLPIAPSASALLVALAGTSYSILLATKTSRRVARPTA